MPPLCAKCTCQQKYGVEVQQEVDQGSHMSPLLGHSLIDLTEQGFESQR